MKQSEFAERKGIRLHGELKDRKGAEGICHSVVLESYALPGQLIVGSDSHTPHSGAIGCVAFGIGTTDVFNSWITKDVRVRVPESVKVVIRGEDIGERDRERLDPENSQSRLCAQRKSSGQGH